MTTADKDLYEIAARKKFRYTHPALGGLITTEDLFDLPLKSARGVDLNGVAQHVNQELKSETEESFVDVRPNLKKAELEVKLEIVKSVIAAKIADAEKAANARKRAEERSKIIDAIASAESRELQGQSKDDLLKKLAELDAA